jgi:hypothetical protein
MDERRQKATKSAKDILAIAGTIFTILSSTEPNQSAKGKLDVPLKQLADEVVTLQAFVNGLK